MSEALLTEFDSNFGLYCRVSEKVASLIRELLAEYKINVHSVTFRTKQRDSLSKKLSKQGRIYRTLSDVTDISGVRIVTYFEEDVDRVVGVLEKEFSVDLDNSVDKRIMLDPDRFGYVSTHHVVNLNESRSQLSEYRWIEGRSVEIQTRSILQHAWAEIEHDLGYKSANQVPKNIRRKFSRLAGLLELADTEFNAIRDELTKYDAELTSKIQTEPDSIGIDRTSLIKFVRESSLVAELDISIATSGGWDLIDNEESVAWNIGKLDKLGIRSIGELEQLLKENSEEIKKFADEWLKRDKADEDDDSTYETNCGISIFYLFYVSLAKKGSRGALIGYLTEHNIGTSEPEDLAEEVFQIYEKIL